MQIQTNASLCQYHTFSIEQSCDVLTHVTSVEEIQHVYQNIEWQTLPKLMLGKGSNMLFTEHFCGVVVINQLQGIEVTESDSAWHLYVAGGEDWPNFVEWSVNQGYFGLENLALIPGCVGSSPIQNIGAYGKELQDVCEYVDVLDLQTFAIKRMNATECQFGYRDSIFKHELFEKVIIVAVGIKLDKAWQPHIEYGPLKAFSAESVTAKQIFDQVCSVRMEKLPNPQVTGNAGSFFKNPVITKQQYQSLIAQHPDLVAYAVDEGMKVAAGWLIDNCGLKGFQQGGAQVHPNQALVLINRNNATAEDIVLLADHVRLAVWQKYSVELEHEVRFMGKQHETNLLELRGALK
ncbi:UDP-N-acetylmuramate dehydrogenase [Vibrio kasasachensis]|uniref:UDP-N-acetylmuramate dehydrogenase n=1 Tax=Vibrio kasasachensis TaxID=2910248 RepID=UPI003D129D17